MILPVVHHGRTTGVRIHVSQHISRQSPIRNPNAEDTILCWRTIHHQGGDETIRGKELEEGSSVLSRNTGGRKPWIRYGVLVPATGWVALWLSEQAGRGMLQGRAAIAIVEASGPSYGRDVVNVRYP